jgi:hypothetical protein
MTSRHGLLPPDLRRDLADLNAQYLDVGLDAQPGMDPRFAWSEGVRLRLAAADRQTRTRMAAVPFALFRLVLPPEGGFDRARGIADLPWPAAGPGWQGRCLSFAHQAAFFARRLLDGAPLAARLVLDLPPDAQALLAGLCPSEVAAAAAHPGLIRPRWPGHLRFWEWLEAAARSDSDSALQWANCMGMCLLGADTDTGPPGSGADPRRRPRR